MKILYSALVGAATLLLAMPAMAHYDVAPYFQNGQLVTGGLDHGGNGVSPTITAYLYDFGEDPYDPYNLNDPGINQAIGVGNLPAGTPLYYTILSSLTYWSGVGEPQFITPPTGTCLNLRMGNTTRTLDDDSGAQPGSLIQSVMADGSLHRHFTSSLFRQAGSSNVPGDSTFQEPVTGIYAFQLELVLSDAGTQYTSNPFWIVLNNGLSEVQHDAARAALGAIPEPASLSLLACGAAALLTRRRKH
jgi:hypothetical protein